MYVESIAVFLPVILNSIHLFNLNRNAGKPSPYVTPEPKARPLSLSLILFDPLAFNF